MGTRADFYIGRGNDAEWIGSIAWDGYPEGIEDTGIFRAADGDSFRAAVIAELKQREDATLPEDGWPWPWDDSGTTDYAYAFDDGYVHASCFGGPWFDATVKDHDEDGEGERAVFPNMRDKKNVAHGSRSGIIVVQG